MGLRTNSGNRWRLLFIDSRAGQAFHFASINGTNKNRARLYCEKLHAAEHAYYVEMACVQQFHGVAYCNNIIKIAL